jgi:hypothetical protein
MIEILCIGGLLALVWLGLLWWDFRRLKSGRDGGHF